MAKRNYTFEFKKKVINFYYSSGEGYIKVAKKFNITREKVRAWVNLYKYHNDEGLMDDGIGKQIFTSEQKKTIVKAIISEKYSISEASYRFKIRNSATISHWMRDYHKYGIKGLEKKSKGNMSMLKNTPTSNKNNPQTLKDAKEIIIRLEAENAYLKDLRKLLKKEAKSQQKSK